MLSHQAIKRNGCLGNLVYWGIHPMVGNEAEIFIIAILGGK